MIARLLKSQAGWGAASVVSKALASVVVVFLAPKSLDAAELGLWFTFFALGAFIELSDFGLGLGYTRAVSYAREGAQELPGTDLEAPAESGGGQPPNRALLAVIVAAATNSYRKAALAVFLLSFVVGGGLFLQSKLAHPLHGWIGWLLFSTGASLGLWGQRWASILNGFGRYREVQRSQAMGWLTCLLFASLALWAGAGLIGLCGAYCAYQALVVCLNRLECRQLEGEWVGAQADGAAPSPAEITTRIWRGSWKHWVVMLCFSGTLFGGTLICAQQLGVAWAGRLGLSQQLGHLITALASVWVNSKIPLIYGLRARGAVDEVRTVFIARMRLGLLSALLGVCAVLALGQQIYLQLGRPEALLPAGLLATLLITQVIEMHYGQHYVLVLTTFHNPFLRPMVISCVILTCLTFIVVPLYGIVGYVLVRAAVALAYLGWYPVILGAQSLNLNLWQYGQHLLKPGPSSSRG